MRRIADLISQELKWEQPSALRMEYELRTGEELIATLRFRSSFGTFAIAESTEGCLTFKRVGFWQTSVTVRQCDSDDDIATFKNNTWSNRGTLELADGRTFQAATNFWQSKFGFTSESGETLIQFNTGGFIHLSAEVSIGPSAVNMLELPWVVMLGWYLVVMIQRDAVVSTTAMNS